MQQEWADRYDKMCCFLYTFNHENEQIAAMSNFAFISNVTCAPCTYIAMQFVLKQLLLKQIVIMLVLFIFICN